MCMPGKWHRARRGKQEVFSGSGVGDIMFYMQCRGDKSMCQEGTRRIRKNGHKFSSCCWRVQMAWWR